MLFALNFHWFMIIILHWNSNIVMLFAKLIKNPLRSFKGIFYFFFLVVLPSLAYMSYQVALNLLEALSIKILFDVCLVRVIYIVGILF